jgi:alkaline phosphatase D
MPLNDRRQWLQMAASAAGAMCLPGAAWAQNPNPDKYPFELGVASGSPTHDGVVLWTRCLLGGSNHTKAQDVTVRWEVANDVHFRQIVQKGLSNAAAALAYSVHVELQGLQPNRWYFYRFMLGDAISPVGRTRTLPAPDAPVESLKLAYASCQKWEDGYFTAWRHMRADNPDLVLFLGDYIYEYPGTSSKFRVPGGGWVLTLDEYRARYALYKSDPDLQTMHASCPWLMVWDDHEVQNDYAGDQAGDGGPPGWDVAQFTARKAAAYQAYYEHMPLRASVLTRALQGLRTGAEMRLYSHLRYGKLASLFLLDGRQYKDPQVCSSGGKRGSSMVDPLRCREWNDPRRSYLGVAQEHWLDKQLAGEAQGAPVWTVIGQPTLFGLRDTGNGDQKQLWNDGWDGYPMARQRLTDSLQRHAAPNPVFMGGDVHENWVGHVLADYSKPQSKVLGVEFCGTSITSRANKSDSTAAQLARNPHFVFADSRHRGYGLALFGPHQLNVRLRVVDDVTQKDTKISTLASFEVKTGKSRLRLM